ncbi:hypothetical protein BVRB_3g068640 [Beta vulgaris subsp. vulgaris]|nr:hypothetical protein BVRB_3g068640 [Beta vulgaris subsp. vulgaris]
MQWVRWGNCEDLRLHSTFFKPNQLLSRYHSLDWKVEVEKLRRFEAFFNTRSRFLTGLR